MTYEFEVSLSDSSLDDVIKKLKQHKQQFERNEEALLNKLGTQIANDAEMQYRSVVYHVTHLAPDGAEHVTQTPDDVEVHHYFEDKKTMTVSATGQDAMFIQFGTGIAHNSPVGTSKHPKGKELGATIGSYDKNGNVPSKGRLKTWFYEQDGQRYATHGIPAQAVLYNAANYAAMDIVNIAKEVFK